MRRPRVRSSVISTLFLGAAVAVLADGPADRSTAQEAVGAAADQTLGEDTASTAARAVAPGSAGMRAFLDPETGQLLSRPSDDETALRPSAGERVEPGHWLNTYSADLLQESLPVGGYKVDLRGRFQTAVVATIDPASGEAAVDCLPAAADEEPSDDR